MSEARLRLVGVDDDVVDDNTGNAHLAGVERAGLRPVLDLGDNDAAAGLARLGHRQASSSAGSSSEVMLPLVSAVVPRTRATSIVEPREEEPLLAVEFHHAHQIPVVMAFIRPPSNPRVDIGVESHLGEDAGLSRCDGRHHLGQHALGEVVALDVVRQDHPRHARRHPQVTGDIAADQARQGQQVGANQQLGGFHRAGVYPTAVAQAGRVEQRQVTWMALL